MGEGLDKAIRQVRSLEFLNDVGENADIFEFREKIKVGGDLRMALISHLKVLFNLPEGEAKEVIEKFVGKIKNES